MVFDRKSIPIVACKQNHPETSLELLAMQKNYRQPKRRYATNHKHSLATAKPAACAKPLMLST